MGLFDIADSILGTDLSGKKARGDIDSALAAAQQGNQQAIDTVKEFGNKAMGIYQRYVEQGMDEQTAMQEAVTDTLTDAYGGARETYQQQYQEAMKARQPLDTAGRSLLQTLPTLQAALGLTPYELTPGPGGELQRSDTTYDVEASPLYQNQLEELDRNLAAQMNAMGLQNSPASALIRSRGVGDLAAGERERQVANMMGLMQAGLNTSANAGQFQMQAGRDLSNLDVGLGQGLAGAQQAVGTNKTNLLTGLGQNLANTTLGMGQNIAQGQATMGQNAMSAGISKAQIPNPMNQLINTGLQLYGMGAFSPGQSQNSGSNLGGVGAANTVNYGLPMMYGLSGAPGMGGY